MKFDDLRKKYPQFIYEGFEMVSEEEGLKIIFCFSTPPDIYFRPEMFFPNTTSIPQNLVFHLGMIELLSYWKATCSPHIIIRAGYLNFEQISWWKNFFVKSLGEFYYTNKIDFTNPDLVDFEIQTPKQKLKLHSRPSSNKDLLMIGGGKDSAVTLGIFEEAGREFGVFSLAPTKSALSIMAKVSKYQIFIKRSIDPKLIELNNKGFLNGHTPISAVYAFYALAAAIIFGFKNVIVSNEVSSNEGNVFYLGQVINHQYSKSFEMEQYLRDYFQNYLSETVSFFSFLRPVNELQISALFAGYPKFHKVFKSCNKGSKENIWCKMCPKCAFVYLMLYPFLCSKLNNIFGEDLLENIALLPIFESLGQIQNKVKPFDCVGTKEEVVTAVYLALEKAKKEHKIPKVLEALKNNVLQGNTDYGKEAEKILGYWNDENNLPQEYVNLLKPKVHSLKALI